MTTSAKFKKLAEKNGVGTLVAIQKDGGFLVYFHPDEKNHMEHGMAAMIEIVKISNEQRLAV